MDASPDHKEQLDFLKKTLERNIESFRSKRISNRKMAFWLKIAVVILGAATTFVLGLKPYLKDIVPNFEHGDPILSAIALLLSAIIPIFMAWDAFFDYRWLWVRYTGVLNTLYGILDELDYVTKAGKVPTERLDGLFKETQKALSDVGADWSLQREKEVSQPAK